jgi:hypothetical protein
MEQVLLVPLVCETCGKDYYRMGHYGDYRCCPVCGEAERERIDGEYRLKLEGVPDDAKPDGRRRTKYREEYCRDIIEAAARGESEGRFAARIGVSKQTVTDWTARHARFAAARTIAHEQLESWFEQHLTLAMVGKIPSSAPLMQLYAKYKLGFTERSDERVSISGDLPILKVVDRNPDYICETAKPEAAGEE